MSADHVQLPVQTVTDHVSTVGAAADSVRQARAAVAQVSMDSQAYGQLCQFLPAVLGVVFEAAVVAMNGSAEALQETALNLRSAVDTFQLTDESAARHIGGPP
ncbi:type VII secretion target [Actinoplanes sp. GCM10030250]|uniref:type VII secretion target n=1 Tax=Actinoplanes sp. GCM10030250 TaxID=3273376 RepID=UPI003619D206